MGVSVLKVVTPSKGLCWSFPVKHASPHTGRLMLPPSQSSATLSEQNPGKTLHRNWKKIAQNSCSEQQSVNHIMRMASSITSLIHTYLYCTHISSSSFFFFFFLLPCCTWDFWARDWIWVRVVTYATAAAIPNPSPTVSAGDQICIPAAVETPLIPLHRSGNSISFLFSYGSFAIHFPASWTKCLHHLFLF